MNWVDVCGFPGVGKSTLCDPLWKPHDIPIDMDRLPPMNWLPFLNEIQRLLELVQPHPSFVAAVRMNRRSVRKIATVARIKYLVPDQKIGIDENGIGYADIKSGPYIQTALVQRGLGFGWRLYQLDMVEEVRGYFEKMPVSIGVPFLLAHKDIVMSRNRARIEIAETAHENRDFMVALMEPAIEIAKEVMRERGVPVVEIDTEQPIEQARAELPPRPRPVPRAHRRPPAMVSHAWRQCEHRRLLRRRQAHRVSKEGQRHH